jgi:hypothetical protein
MYFITLEENGKKIRHVFPTVEDENSCRKTLIKKLHSPPEETEEAGRPSLYQHFPNLGLLSKS